MSYGYSSEYLEASEMPDGPMREIIDGTVKEAARFREEKLREAMTMALGEGWSPVQVRMEHRLESKMDRVTMEETVELNGTPIMRWAPPEVKIEHSKELQTHKMQVKYQVWIIGDEETA